MTLELVPWRGSRVPVLARDEISRFNVADLIGMINAQQGLNGYMAPPPVQTTYGNRPVEPISTSFEGFAWGMLYVDGPVAAVEAYRLRVFGQAPLLFQEIVDGRAGDLFDDEALDRLRAPWTGATLSDLMKRTLIYADLVGNAFVADLEDELVLLRPDWVEIVLEKRMFRGQQLGWKQLGIVYYEGGRGRGADGVPFLPGEYAHFIPGLPDPLATYRGMSWLTPLIRDVQSDRAAMDHKVAFFENSASPNLAVSLPKEVSPSQFNEFVELMDSKHKGVQNAGRTLYTGGGADVTVIGANMQQQDWSSVVGKSETRIANAGGVSPVLLSFSEGMQGSSLNAGNYTPAKRNFVDTTMRDLWANFAGSIGQMDAFQPPKDHCRLWYDGRDIPFLHEDAKDLAEIQQTQASTLASYVTNGWKPESAVKAVAQDDITLLEHTGAFSVQLQPPTPGGDVPDLNNNGLADDSAPADGASPDAAPPDFGALRADFWEYDEEDILRAVEDMFDLDEDDIERARYDVRVAEGHVGGGRFRKLSDVAAALLHDWAKGDGEDDPLAKFERPQLLTILKDLRAKALADGDHERAARLTPRRAATPEQLKAALYNDVRGHVRGERDVKAQAPKKAAKFTLQSGKLRDVDVAVYRDKDGKPSLFRESESGRRGSLVARFDSLDEMAKWADDNNEPHVGDWARKESGTVQTDKGGRISKEEAGRRMYGDKGYEAKAAKKTAKKAPAKAASPGEKTQARGRDLLADDGDALTRRAIAGQDNPDSADGALSVIAHEQGFDGKPTVVSKAEFDKLAAGGATVLYRGQQGTTLPDGTHLSAAQMQEQFRSGGYFGGRGFFGNGYYASAGQATAADQYGDGTPGSVSRLLIKPDAKRITHSALREEMRQYRREHGISLDSPEGQLWSNPGRFAAARGYDVIDVDDGGDESWSVVVNRTAVIAEAPSARKAAPAKRTPAVEAGPEEQLRGLPTSRVRKVATALGVQLPDGATSKPAILAAIDAQMAQARLRAGDHFGSRLSKADLIAEAIADTEPHAGAGDVQGAVARLRELDGSGATLEGAALRVLAGDGGLTSAKLRQVADGLGIDVPPDMRNKIALEKHIAARLAVSPAPRVSAPDPTGERLTAAARLAAPDPEALDARLRSATPDDRRRILDEAATNPTQARRLAAQLGIKGVSRLSRDEALARIVAHYEPSPEPIPKPATKQFAATEEQAARFIGPREATPEQVDRAAQEVAQLNVAQLRQLLDSLNVALPKPRGRAATRTDLEYALFSEVVGHGRRQGNGGVTAGLDNIARQARTVREGPALAPSVARRPRGQGQQEGLSHLIESARQPGEAGRPARETLADLEAKGVIRQEGGTWVLAATSKAAPSVPPAPEAQARTRQAAIDSARNVADALTQVDELVSNNASPAALESRITAARGRGLPDADAEALLAAVRGGQAPEAAAKTYPALDVNFVVGNQIATAGFKLGSDQAFSGRRQWDPSGSGKNYLTDADARLSRQSPREVADWLDGEARKAALYDGKGDQDPHYLRDLAARLREPDVTAAWEALHERHRDRLAAVSARLNATDPRAELDRVRADIASRHGLTPISTAGAVETYDPARHDTLSGRSLSGPVRVVRPGYEYQRQDPATGATETVRLSKPVVERDIPATSGDTVQPIDFLGRFNSAREAGLDAAEAEQFAESGMSLEQWREAHRSEDLDEDDIERAEVDEDGDIVEPDDDEDDPSLDDIMAMAEEDDETSRAAGHDVTPGHDELHHYWTRGEGLAKWAESPKPWTTLVAHLTKYVGPEKAKTYASRWFIEVFGFAAGSDLNRVTHGKSPRGHRVGPG